MGRSEEETFEVLWSCAAYADRTSLYNSSLGHQMESEKLGTLGSRTVEKQSEQTGWEKWERAKACARNRAGCRGRVEALCVKESEEARYAGR